MDSSKSVFATEDILRHVSFIRHKRQEYFVCLSLDGYSRVIKRRTVTIGLLDAALVHPREVFAGALKDGAVAIVVAHNHPSGEAAPSRQDIEATQQLAITGQLLGIKLADHLIVTKQTHYSFKNEGLLLQI